MGVTFLRLQLPHFQDTGMLIATSCLFQAKSIAKIMGNKFHDEPGWAKGGKTRRTVSTKGIVLLLYAVKSNSIGFKGFGFSTCNFPAYCGKVE